MLNGANRRKRLEWREEITKSGTLYVLERMEGCSEPWIDYGTERGSYQRVNIKKDVKKRKKFEQDRQDLKIVVGKSLEKKGKEDVSLLPQHTAALQTNTG